MIKIDVEIDDSELSAEALKAQLEGELAQRINGTVSCPVHGVITGMGVALDDDLESAELVGQVCCDAGNDALKKALGGD
jgi:hypothetical protein